MRLLAEKVRPINPKLVDFLLEARFVGDLNDSPANLTDAGALKKAVDKVFAEFGAECKGWFIKGLPPHCGLRRTLGQNVNFSNQASYS